MKSLSRNRKAKELKKYGNSWTGRRVLAEAHKEEIKALLKMEWDADPGIRKYLEHYQHAVTRVVDEKTQDQRDAADAQAAAWNNGMLPDDIRIR